MRAIKPSMKMAFVVGRYYGSGRWHRVEAKAGGICRLSRRAPKNGFSNVLILRLMYLPFDLVSYSAGMCDLKHEDFALGTFLGTLPGLAIFILLGSSLENQIFLFLAVFLAICGYFTSWMLKSRLPSAFEQQQ